MVLETTIDTISGDQLATSSPKNVAGEASPTSVANTDAPESRDAAVATPSDASPTAAPVATLSPTTAKEQREEPEGVPKLFEALYAKTEAFLGDMTGVCGQAAGATKEAAAGFPLPEDYMNTISMATERAQSFVGEIAESESFKHAVDELEKGFKQAEDAVFPKKKEKTQGDLAAAAPSVEKVEQEDKNKALGVDMKELELADAALSVEKVEQDNLNKAVEADMKAFAKGAPEVKNKEDTVEKVDKVLEAVVVKEENKEALEEVKPEVEEKKVVEEEAAKSKVEEEEAPVEEETKPEVEGEKVIEEEAAKSKVEEEATPVEEETKPEVEGEKAIEKEAAKSEVEQDATPVEEEVKPVKEIVAVDESSKEQADAGSEEAAKSEDKPEAAVEVEDKGKSKKMKNSRLKSFKKSSISKPNLSVPDMPKLPSSPKMTRSLSKAKPQMSKRFSKPSIGKLSKKPQEEKNWFDKDGATVVEPMEKTETKKSAKSVKDLKKGVQSSFRRHLSPSRSRK